MNYAVNLFHKTRITVKELNWRQIMVLWNLITNSVTYINATDIFLKTRSKNRIFDPLISPFCEHICELLSHNVYIYIYVLKLLSTTNTICYQEFETVNTHKWMGKGNIVWMKLTWRRVESRWKKGLFGITRQ